MHGDAPQESRLEKAIWFLACRGAQGGARSTLSAIGEGRRSEPWAITKLMLLYHLFDGCVEPGLAPNTATKYSGQSSIVSPSAHTDFTSC
jgi:hypothetical protein